MMLPDVVFIPCPVTRRAAAENSAPVTPQTVVHFRKLRNNRKVGSGQEWASGNLTAWLYGCLIIIPKMMTGRENHPGDRRRVVLS